MEGTRTSAASAISELAAILIKPLNYVWPDVFLNATLYAFYAFYF